MALQGSLRNVEMARRRAVAAAATACISPEPAVALGRGGSTLSAAAQLPVQPRRSASGGSPLAARSSATMNRPEQGSPGKGMPASAHRSTQIRPAAASCADKRMLERSRISASNASSACALMCTGTSAHPVGGWLGGGGAHASVSGSAGAAGTLRTASAAAMEGNALKASGQRRPRSSSTATGSTSPRTARASSPSSVTQRCPSVSLWLNVADSTPPPQSRRVRRSASSGASPESMAAVLGSTRKGSARAALAENGTALKPRPLLNNLSTSASKTHTSSGTPVPCTLATSQREAPSKALAANSG